MNSKRTIIFVCEHGAAKSIIAAAYFNKLAGETNLPFHAIARGTNPDAELSPKACAGLQADGLTPAEPIPLKLSPAEVELAGRIVAFCELPEEVRGEAPIEQWQDVPPVSQIYERARDAILSNLHRLIEKIEIEK